MSALSRREFLATLSAAGIAPTAFAGGRGGERPGGGAGPAFLHGVASGDPLHDRVILWTRVTPKRLGDVVHGRWSVATDHKLRKVVRSGGFVTDVTRDFTVKIDAAGLKPDSVYYYRFETRGAESVVGRTRTLPLFFKKRWRMAFASCSNYPYGYFNAYGRIAARTDIDLVLHLGDYLYEYAQGEYANPALASLRDVVPSNEILSLTDYRLRHALYKSDPDLQELHRLQPFICVWDDHESANDAWRDGAENHDPENGEGEWVVRRRQAVRAYNEYMPIRSGHYFDDRIYRRFRIGNLADLIMLDTRLHGRDLQAAFKSGQSELPANDPTINDGARTLLGFDQEAWLERRLWESKMRGAQWRVLGQQVMMAQLSSTFGQSFINPDQWDGYRPARERLYRHLLDNDIANNVVLTGDIHSSWCSDLTLNPWDAAAYNPQTGAGVVGAEFVCPAVTSPGPVPDAAADTLAMQLRFVSPHMKYINLNRRGYGVLDLSHQAARCEIYHVATVDAKDERETLATVMVSEAGNNVVKSASEQAPSSPSAVNF
ncbi:alkaline phosphatase D family protein [Steroidobacter sp. S1-65]|uniref:Alkaline phosphatase D family protein n=1 Tax=Steroidobacter gossypii TaxID=2805490 RepID=A0ABS1X4L8_9GAMM|nr:alkaline phosphatase D family protein [Steroidobacter gossypii]MBM0108157.1 alkaline phosphatase D family protein [Steroidobacter gossypii]